MFKITKTGTLTTLHSFSNTSPPSAGLVFGPDGNLYGTTGYDCGTPNNRVPSGASGTVFVITPSGQDFSTLQSFATQPAGALMLASDGNFYGVTYNSVFKMTPGGTATSSECSPLPRGPGFANWRSLLRGYFSKPPPSGEVIAFKTVLLGADTVSNHDGRRRIGHSIVLLVISRGWGRWSMPRRPRRSRSGGGMTLGPDGNYFGLLWCGPYTSAVGIIAGTYTLSSAGAYSSSNIAAFAKNVDQPTGELTLGSDGDSMASLRTAAPSSR